MTGLQAIADMIRNVLFLVSTLSHGISADEDKIRKIIRDLDECAEALERPLGSLPLDIIRGMSLCTEDRLLGKVTALVSLVASRRVFETRKVPSTLVIPLCGVSLSRNALGCERFMEVEADSHQALNTYIRHQGWSPLLSQYIEERCPGFGPVRVVGVTDGHVLNHPNGDWTRLAHCIAEELQALLGSGVLDLSPMTGEEE